MCIGGAALVVIWSALISANLLILCVFMSRQGLRLCNFGRVSTCVASAMFDYIIHFMADHIILAMD